MTRQDDEHQLPLERRMELFQAVVETQDSGVDTVLTRRRIAKQFGVTERTVRRIEDEGLEGQWPPLDADLRLERQKS